MTQATHAKVYFSFDFQQIIVKFLRFVKTQNYNTTGKSSKAHSEACNNNNCAVVFIPVVEHCTSSLPWLQYWKLHGGFYNNFHRGFAKGIWPYPSRWSLKSAPGVQAQDSISFCLCTRLTVEADSTKAAFIFLFSGLFGFFSMDSISHCNRDVWSESSWVAWGSHHRFLQIIWCWFFIERWPLKFTGADDSRMWWE